MTQHSEAAMPADPMLVAAYLIGGCGPAQASEQASEAAEIASELAELEGELACSLVASNPGRTYDEALDWLRGPGPDAWLEEHGY